MRLFLWLVAFFLAVLLIGVLYLLFRSKLLPNIAFSNETFNIVSLAVNVALFVITIFTLLVAMAAYYSAEQSGKQQQQTLGASRQALESVVGVALKQQELLDENLKIAKAQLEVVREQREDERKRFSRKPQIEVMLGEVTEARIREAKEITVAVGEDGGVPMAFIIKNVGDATLLQPSLFLVGEPKTIIVRKTGQSKDASSPQNVLQIAGAAVMDMPPFEITQTPSAFNVEIVVPQDLTIFTLHFKMWGTNLTVHALDIRFRVQHKTQSPG